VKEGEAAKNDNHEKSEEDAKKATDEKAKLVKEEAA